MELGLIMNIKHDICIMLNIDIRQICWDSVDVYIDRNVGYQPQIVADEELILKSFDPDNINNLVFMEMKAYEY